MPHRQPSVCPCEGCDRAVDTALYVMCSRCWALVPPDVASGVYAAWGARVRGHHADELVEAHEAAKRAAIDAVNRARGRAPQEVLDV